MNPYLPADPAHRSALHDPDCVLRAVRATKSYEGKLALDGVDIEVRRGDLFGLVGSNGAGKTTFLRVAASLLTLTEGAMYVGGYSTRIWPSLVRRQIGWLPDSPAFEERIPVHLHLEFFALLAHLPTDRRRAAVAEALELVDLADAGGKEVRALSRGQQQRLALARLVLQRPTVFLLDEPVSGLDPRARIEVLELLRRLTRVGRTVVISSHILHDLERYCNRIAILEEGRLRFTGELAAARAEMAGEMRHYVEVAERATEAAYDLAAAPCARDVALDDARRVPRVCFRPAAPERDAGAAVHWLVAHGHRVVAVGRDEPTLGDVFLRHTAGKVS